MTTRIWLQMILCVLVALSAAACCCAGVTWQYEASDLVGTWRADYDKHEYERRGCWPGVTGVETLTLRADGMYQQVYDDEKGYVYTSPWNRWYLERQRGHVYVHLEGGRFYPLGIEDAEKLANGRLFYRSDDDGTGRPFDLDSTTGIFLRVSSGWYIFEGRHEVTLEYPPVCDLDSPVIVTFHRVATTVPISTAPP